MPVALGHQDSTSWSWCNPCHKSSFASRKHPGFGLPGQTCPLLIGYPSPAQLTVRTGASAHCSGHPCVWQCLLCRLVWWWCLQRPHSKIAQRQRRHPRHVQRSQLPGRFCRLWLAMIYQTTCEWRVHTNNGSVHEQYTVNSCFYLQSNSVFMHSRKRTGTLLKMDIGFFHCLRSLVSGHSMFSLL